MSQALERLQPSCGLASRIRTNPFRPFPPIQRVLTLGVGWKIRFDKRAFRELERLSAENKRRVQAFLDDRLLPSNNPRAFGKALTGEFSGMWRYRVGDIRIVVRIIDNELVILVIAIGHRRAIYR